MIFNMDDYFSTIKEDYGNRECLGKCVELFMRENCDVCKKVFRSKGGSYISCRDCS